MRACDLRRPTRTGIEWARRMTSMRNASPRAMRLGPPCLRVREESPFGFAAPHDLKKELECRHSSFAKNRHRTIVGTNGIRFQGQRQGAPLRCTAGHPAVVADPR